jgi:hypothetical protein
MTARNEQQVNHDSNEDQQLVGTGAGSCTFNHILRDDPALLLTVAAHEHGSNQVPISTQYDSQKEIGVLAPAHPKYDLQGVQEDEQWLCGNNDGVIVTKPTNNDVLIQTLPLLTVPSTTSISKHNQGDEALYTQDNNNLEHIGRGGDSTRVGVGDNRTNSTITVSTAHNCKQTMESETHFVGGGGNITWAFLGTGISLQTVSKLFLTKQ